MNTKIPARIAMLIMNSLKSGVVPRTGLGYIAVGRESEINALLSDVAIVEEGGATFRFVVGKYGSGKSFLLQTIRAHVMDRNFVVIDADLSPDRRLSGNTGQGLATYRELLKNMSTKTKPDGGALPFILDKWISMIQNDILQKDGISPDDPRFMRLVEAKIHENINNIEGLVHGFDFARIINMYWVAYRDGDDDKKSKALKWIRGEYTNRTEAKLNVGINVIISDNNWYEYVKILSVFMVGAGYKGMIMLVDELVNLYKIPHGNSRQANYEKILAMYNDTLQGKAQYLGIIMSGTPQCIEDTKRGIFSYEALKSRLEDSRFARDDRRDMLAPIIRLKPLTPEELIILMEKLTNIHADLHGYKKTITENEIVEFIKVEFGRVGADSNITPREVIRDYIEILNTLYQYPDKTMADIIHDEKFYSTNNNGEVHDDFANFEL